MKELPQIHTLVVVLVVAAVCQFTVFPELLLFSLHKGLVCEEDHGNLVDMLTWVIVFLVSRSIPPGYTPLLSSVILRLVPVAWSTTILKFVHLCIWSSLANEILRYAVTYNSHAAYCGLERNLYPAAVGVFFMLEKLGQMTLVLPDREEEEECELEDD